MELSGIPIEVKIMLNKLTDIGFKKVGCCILENDVLEIIIDTEGDLKNILYTFVIDGEPMYVGKTTQTLKKRMYGYKKPGSTQATNIRNNKNIIKALKKNKKVALYALPDNGLLHFGAFHLNLAAGLEDNIVKTISPKWNLTGK
jgi:hypothetical protein